MSGTISQAATEVSVSETDGTITVTFLRTGDLSGATRLTYGVTSNTATPGLDYNHAFSTVDFAAGQSRATITIGLVNDALGEPTETFTVSLITATNGASISVPRTVRINILDDETPAPPGPAEPPLTPSYLVGTQTLATGLDQPVNMEFLPTNPDIVLVAEKSGLIRKFDIETGQDLGTFLDLRPVVNDYIDRGLMDIAVHPDFANNPYIYVFYVADPPGATTPGGNRYSQVVRLTADAATGFTTVVAGSAVVIAGAGGASAADINGGGVLDFSDPQFVSSLSSERYINPSDPTPPIAVGGFKPDYLKVDSNTHAGGSLAFGPDGMLYISTGDGVSANYADPRGGDVQNVHSLSGKILRVDPITGQGLADNPFHVAGDSLDSNRSKVFQLGLRNPFSIGFRDDGQLFITDTGWNTFEEVNTGGPGANFGWPWFEGGTGGELVQTDGFRGLPAAAAFYTQVAAGQILITAPFLGLGHAESEPGFQNQVITGGSVIYDGNQYPAEFTGEYFFTNFAFGRVFTVDTNDSSDVQFLYQSPSTFAPSHFVQGPDGFVYYTDFGMFDGAFTNGSIGRLQIFPFGGPGVTVSAPVVAFEGTNATAQVVFTLSAVQASDVVVTYDVVDGTAVNGSDFTSPGRAQITIPAGQTSVSLAIPLIDNTVFELPESFRVVLFEAATYGGFIAAIDDALVQIRDNEPAPAGTNFLVNGSFELPGIDPGEFSKFLGVPGWTALTGGQIEVWNAHGGLVASNGAHFLELDSADDLDGFFQDVFTAAGISYALSVDLQLRPGRPVGTQSVEVLWNGVVVATAVPGAGWGTFTVNVIGTGGADRLTIREVAAQGDDGLGAMLDNFRLISNGPPPPSVTVSATPGTVTEGVAVLATATFTLSVVQAVDTVVTYSTVNGTAVAGSDFTGRTAATVVIPAGQTSVAVTIPVLNDVVFEPSETFAVRLDSAVAGATSLVATGSATITILDNDVPPPNLLVNGSFELPGVAAGGYGDFASVPGWTALTGGRIEVWNTHRGIVPTDGVHSLELDFDGARDGFFQDVTTVSGQSYTLSFDLQTRPGFAASTQSVEVVWNGVVVATAVPATAWSTFTVNVTGTGAADRLTIREVTAQGGDGIGAMLDNFRLVSNGPPAGAEVQTDKAIVSEVLAPVAVNDNKTPAPEVYELPLLSGDDGAAASRATFDAREVAASAVMEAQHQGRSLPPADLAWTWAPAGSVFGSAGASVLDEPWDFSRLGPADTPAGGDEWAQLALALDPVGAHGVAVSMSNANSLAGDWMMIAVLQDDDLSRALPDHFADW